MPRQFSYAKILVVVALFLGSSVAAFGANAADDAMQAKSPKYDFTVVLATKDQTHPHFGEGSEVGFVVNGVQGRTLVLVRGKTYTFDVASSPMHDFYLSTDPMGWGVGTLTAGVEGNFTFKGVVTFKPTAETPDLVYYQCRNHKYMGGTIHVVNPGEEDKIKIAQPTVKAAPAQNVHSTLNKNEIKQRLSFVEMFIGNAAKRIAASSNEEAKEEYKNAQDRLVAAKEAFDSGNLQEAKTRSDEAMDLMTKATKHVPSESMLKMAKSRNEELMQGLIAMEVSYKQNYEVIVGGGGAQDIPKLDSEKIHKMMDSAKALSEKGNYDEANKILSSTMNEMSGALNKMLANRAISYEMKFSSPAQEYEHELARFSTLEDSLQQAIAQEKPLPSTVTMMNYYVSKGKEKRDQASADAKQQNFAAALENIKKATEQLDAAFKLLNLH